MLTNAFNRVKGLGEVKKDAYYVWKCIKCMSDFLEKTK